MPFTKFTNLDFDQIKTSIKDYLRANSTFTDFDFDGSNFSVLINTLAYNTYITAFNSNMVVNESFLDSATLRQNVVSLARNIGYVPRSRTASKAQVSFSVQTNQSTSQVVLKAGLVCVGNIDNTSYTFSIPKSITTNLSSGVAAFNNIDIYQGTYLTKQFIVDGSLDQKFILDNSYIDTSTIVVYAKGINDTGLGREYFLADDIFNIDSNSEIYLIQEIQDEKYELLFGDGIFGKKLQNNTIITVSYIITDGTDGNGASKFSFAGTFNNSLGNPLAVQSNTITINTVSPSNNGGDVESINSIKYFAPHLYSSQNRAVTARDYESIVKRIYPNADSVSIVGGEELSPPQFGNVLISIKPKNGEYVSDFDKKFILSNLKQYSLSGINQQIIDLKILYVEIDCSIYYNSTQVGNPSDLKNKTTDALSTYSTSIDVNKFGGRFKYSKILQLIDNVDVAITSNITKVIIRRNLNALINQFTQYELCFGNAFHVNVNGYNIKSTGFTISGTSESVYLTDTPNKSDNYQTGILSIVKNDDKRTVVVKSAGTVNYITGEIILRTILITSTEKPNSVIEIQAYPDSNDVIGLKDLYLEFDVAKSNINMIRDTISSGEQISGVGFKVTSSYSNGDLTRK